MKFKIAIDAGHGIDTPGKRTPNGVREWILNNGYANELIALLTQYNVEVLRVDDKTGKTDVPLQERVAKAKAFGANLYISLHSNASGDTWSSANGVETLVDAQANKTTRALASAVQLRLAEYTKRRNRGVVVRDDLYVLNATQRLNMPAFLVEAGFMSNHDEAELMQSVGYQRNVAKAVLDGVLTVVKLERRPKPTPKVKHDDMPVLRKGDEGKYVILLQQELVKDLRVKLTIDGKFGNMTEALVKAYQKKCKLVKDGVVGKETWNKLL